MRLIEPVRFIIFKIKNWFFYVVYIKITIYYCYVVIFIDTNDFFQSRNRNIQCIYFTFDINHSANVQRPIHHKIFVDSQTPVYRNVVCKHSYGVTGCYMSCYHFQFIYFTFDIVHSSYVERPVDSQRNAHVHRPRHV